jgi:hypothetical protein
MESTAPQRGYQHLIPAPLKLNSIQQITTMDSRDCSEETGFKPWMFEVLRFGAEGTPRTMAHHSTLHEEALAYTSVVKLVVQLPTAFP